MTKGVSVDILLSVFFLKGAIAAAFPQGNVCFVSPMRITFNYFSCIDTYP